MTSKQELKATIKLQREHLESDLDDLAQAGRALGSTTTAVLCDPVGSFNQALINRMSSRKVWESLGIAFFVGGALTYFVRPRTTDWPKESNSQPVLLGMIEPLAVEFVEQSQQFGRRLIRNLFHMI